MTSETLAVTRETRMYSCLEQLEATDEELCNSIIFLGALTYPCTDYYWYPNKFIRDKGNNSQRQVFDNYGTCN